MDFRKVIGIGIALALAPTQALAVEGAVGRTLPGMWVMPQAGVVPDTPGFSFTVMPIGYIGKISGTDPIAGQLVANVHASVSENLLIPQYVYKTELTKVSLSSSFYLPVNYVGVTGAVQLNNLFANRHETNRGLSDVFFSPLTVGIHFSENNNLAIDTKIWAPTGDFERLSLSNLGMNAYTIQPSLAHTLLWKKRGLEVDNNVGFDIYARNPLTNYTSGTMFHWDGMVIQYLSERFGFGAIVSNLTQITKDTGSPLASALNGFQGGAWGAGPIVLWVAKPKDPGISLQLRWVHEFTTTNLMKGNTLLFGLTLRQ